MKAFLLAKPNPFKWVRFISGYFCYYRFSFNSAEIFHSLLVVTLFYFFLYHLVLVLKYISLYVFLFYCS